MSKKREQPYSQFSDLIGHRLFGRCLCRRSFGRHHEFPLLIWLCSYEARCGGDNISKDFESRAIDHLDYIKSPRTSPLQPCIVDIRASACVSSSDRYYRSPSLLVGDWAVHTEMALSPALFWGSV
jgi:hypothetical protein